MSCVGGSCGTVLRLFVIVSTALQSASRPSREEDQMVLGLGGVALSPGMKLPSQLAEDHAGALFSSTRLTMAWRTALSNQLLD